MWAYSDGSLTNYFEFKCRSEKTDGADLVDGLRRDVEKIQGIMVDRKGTRAWIMAFFVDDGKPSGLESWIYNLSMGLEWSSQLISNYSENII